MKTKAEATIEDLMRVPGKAELVNGEVLLMSPTGGIPGWAGDEIRDSLAIYARSGPVKGIAVGDNKAFVVDLPGRRSFSPDAGYFTGQMGRSYYKGAPVFAVEVRSEGDYGPAADRKITAKIKDYFAAGTQVVWDVDVLRDGVVRVYRADKPTDPTVYHRGEVAEAEPALPGWTMPVDDLFYTATEDLS